MLTRIAALVASDAAPASYMMHFKAAMEMGFDRDTVASVLVAIAPLVGSAKITSAVSHMARAKLLGDEMQRRMSEQYGDAHPHRSDRTTSSCPTVIPARASSTHACRASSAGPSGASA